VSDGNDGTGSDEGEGRADIRRGTRHDFNVEVTRDLSGSGRLVRGASARALTLHFRAAGTPVPAQESAGAAAPPATGAAAPVAPAEGDAVSGRPAEVAAVPESEVDRGLLHRVSALFRRG
jgi:hypothetical protein